MSSERELDEAATPPRVGVTLQRIRLERGMTLEQLSRAAGVSKSMLSEIKRDKANPTIAVTWRLANALGLGLDQLLGAGRRTPAPVEVLSADQLPSLTAANSSHSLRILGPMELAGRFEWYDLALAPKALKSAGHDPGTREHLTVLQGVVDVAVEGLRKRVRVGETARYAADALHEIRNAGRSTARGLLIVIHG
jgi:transcriptional regulator with XRE-family HTH domain